MGIANSIVSTIKKVKLPIPAKVSLKLKKHTPDIMLVSGVVIVIGSAVYACKKSFDARDILENAQKKIDNINYGEDVANGHEDFDEKAARKERMIVYREMSVDILKCYGPSIAGAAIGFGLIFGAHKIEKDRNLALTSAYAGLLANYNNYRERVREELGEERERDICAGARKQDIVVTDENGKEKKIKDAKVISEPGSKYSPYARIFDENNTNWDPGRGNNVFFLKQQQRYANDKLRRQGYLFLNEVYESLGFPKTSAGQIVGWVWDPKDIENRDCVVDFGIFNEYCYNEEVSDFINGFENSVWLDFNVDGIMYDLI